MHFLTSLISQYGPRPEKFVLYQKLLNVATRHKEAAPQARKCHAAVQHWTFSGVSSPFCAESEPTIIGAVFGRTWWHGEHA